MRKVDRIINSLDQDEIDEFIVAGLKKRPATLLASAKTERTQLSHISEYVEEAQATMASWGGMQGLSTGFKNLDELVKGLVGGELIIVSGQTSHGKTQLAANIAYNLAKVGEPVLFVTLEMTKLELTRRIIKLAEPNDGVGLPVFYQLATEINYNDINQLIKRAVDDGAKLVVIDHLHYFLRSVEFANQEIGKIVKEFKRAAIENNVPVMLLSHVRKLERNKEPEIDDLRDSSFIGQDADVVLMVWRDMKEGAPSPEDVTVKIHKNRNRGLFAGQRVAYFKHDGVKLNEETF